MKNFWKKCLVLLVAITVAISTLGLVACSGGGGGGGGGEEEKVDTTKTQLYVTNFNGGFGSEWLYQAKAKYEELHKDDSYETGKVGVQIMLTEAKESGAAIINTMKTAKHNVYFTESVSYKNFVLNENMIDITDIVTTPNPADGNKKIIDKFTANQKSALNMDGKYYAIPHYEGYMGITLNFDLIDELCLFFLSDNSLNEDDEYTFDQAKAANDLGTGPDGLTGTYDDGLPRTYAEFFELADALATRGVVAWGWGGKVMEYLNQFAGELVANSLGEEEFLLNFNCKGTTNKYVASYNNSYGAIGATIPTTSKTVTDAYENGYEFTKTSGYIDAYKFINELANRKNSGKAMYYSKSYTVAQTHMDAQRDYILSRKSGAIGNAPNAIAMHIDGTYWLNEADSSFKSMATKYGDNYSRKESRFIFLPLPKPTDAQVGEDLTLFDVVRSYGFINGNLEENENIKALAKEFLQYCNTDEILQLFTTCTDTPKALEYEMSSENYNKLTFYGKKLWNMKHDDKTTIVSLSATEDIFYKNENTLMMNNRFHVDTESVLVKAVKEGATMQEMFDGVYKYWQETWPQLVK